MRTPPLVTTAGLGRALTVPVAGKSHTRKTNRGGGSRHSAPRSGGCGFPAGHTVRATTTLLCAVLLPGACRVKTRTHSSGSLCQNLESRAPGGERAAGTGRAAIPDTPFLSLTLSYVRLDVRSTRLRWMGPCGRRGRGSPRGRGTGLIMSGLWARGWGLGGHQPLPIFTLPPGAALGAHGSEPPGKGLC